MAPGGNVTLIPGFPEENSNVPSGGTRQALDTGRETTRNHEKCGTWQWAQSRCARGTGSEGTVLGSAAPGLLLRQAWVMALTLGASSSRRVSKSLQPSSLRVLTTTSRQRRTRGGTNSSHRPTSYRARAA